MFFFFNDTATTEIYTLSLHDALPIFHPSRRDHAAALRHVRRDRHRPVHRARFALRHPRRRRRSEEHTSELQSRLHLVCRLLLEKKKIGRELHAMLGIMLATPDSEPVR